MDAEFSALASTSQTIEWGVIKWELFETREIPKRSGVAIYWMLKNGEEFPLEGAGTSISELRPRPRGDD